MIGENINEFLNKENRWSNWLNDNTKQIRPNNQNSFDLDKNTLV